MATTLTTNPTTNRRPVRPVSQLGMRHVPVAAPAHPALVPTLRELAEIVEVCRRAQRVAELRRTADNLARAAQRAAQLDAVVASILRLAARRPPTTTDARAED